MAGGDREQKADCLPLPTPDDWAAALQDRQGDEGYPGRVPAGADPDDDYEALLKAAWENLGPEGRSKKALITHKSDKVSAALDLAQRWCGRIWAPVHPASRHTEAAASSTARCLCSKVQSE